MRAAAKLRVNEPRRTRWHSASCAIASVAQVKSARDAADTRAHTPEDEATIRETLVVADSKSWQAIYSNERARRVSVACRFSNCLLNRLTVCLRDDLPEDRLNRLLTFHSIRFISLLFFVFFFFLLTTWDDSEISDFNLIVYSILSKLTNVHTYKHILGFINIKTPAMFLYRRSNVIDGIVRVISWKSSL